MVVSIPTDKFEIITALEGREIQTPDGEWHLVEDGKFITRYGDTVSLIGVQPSILEAYYRQSRRPCQWLDDIIEEANKSGRIVRARVVYGTEKGKVIFSSGRRGFLRLVVWKGGLPQRSFTLAAWNAQARKWEVVKGVLEKVTVLN